MGVVQAFEGSGPEVGIDIQEAEDLLERLSTTVSQLVGVDHEHLLRREVLEVLLHLVPVAAVSDQLGSLPRIGESSFE